jgi:hypothetical protein
MTNFMHDFGPTLIDNGYNIIPVVQGTKRPALANWPKIKATPELIESWDADASIGITTGEVVAIDVDIYDKDVTNAIVKYCDKHIGKGLRRIGKAPKGLLLFRTDTPMAKSVSPKYMDEDGNVNCVEILGKGQQLVAYGIHPDTQKEYLWPKACPTTVPIADLPTIDAEQITELFLFFDRSTPAKWKRISHGALSPQPQPRTQPAANQDNVLNFEHMKQPTGISTKELKRHLSLMDAEPYDEWLLVGQALHHEFDGGYDGLTHWVDWSSNASSYDGHELLESKWASFSTLREDAVVTMRTVIATAQTRTKEVKQQVAVEQATGLEASTLLDFDVDNFSVSPREWVLGSRLLAGYITATFAPGGVSKSMFSMITAVSVATGLKLTNEEVHRKGKVWLINNEDDTDEQYRRLMGIAQHHNIPWQTLKENLYLTCGYGNPYIVAHEGPDGVVAHPNADKIIEEALAKGITYIVFDPFITMHQTEENDNGAIQQVTNVLKRIAKETGAAIEVVHHTKKAGAKSDSETHAGDVESGRGASSLKDACRIAITLARMAPKTADKLGINYEDEGRFLVRLDHGKGNFSGPPEGATWFKQVSVLLSNGDTVGVHEFFDISELVDEAKQRDVENTREQIKQLRLDICETLPEGTTELPVLLSNLQIIWGKSSDTRRRYVADALVLDEQVGILGADSVEYGVTLVSRLSKNDKFNVIKERL